jgi:chromosome segregation ATPase
MAPTSSIKSLALPGNSVAALADIFVPSHLDIELDVTTVARTVIVAQDLCDELDRWSAYASAAEHEAEVTARQTGEAVSLAVRHAAFVSDLSQRNELDLTAVAAMVEEAAEKAKHTIDRLAARRASWLQTQQLAEQAVVSWTAAYEQASHDLAALEQRLRHARRREERIASAAAELPSGFLRSRKKARRDVSRSDRQLAEVSAAVAQYAAEVAPAEKSVERASKALTTAETARSLAERAVAELAEGRDAAGMANDYVASSRQALASARTALANQSSRADTMMRESRLSVRQLELSGRLLGAASSTYDDAQRHVFDARRDIGDHIELLRQHYSQAVHRHD